jgi:hypothetical protein
LELRYTLITSSINSLSRNLLPTLLAAFMADGTWSITEALRYAAQQPYAPLRAEAFALLAELARKRWHSAACGRRAAPPTRSATGPTGGVRALGQVAAYAPSDVRHDAIREALDVVREIDLVEAD